MLDTPTTMLLMIIGFIITISAQVFVKSSYNQYRKIGNRKNLTGFEIARKILDKHGLENIHVVETKGMLTDHYDPRRKVVRLSTEVFHGDSIASISIAAHEASHAIQHKDGYFYMKLRGMIAPIVGFGSKLGYVAIFLGIISGIANFVTLGIILLFSIIVFELVTLPVEYDASKRAKIDLNKEKILESEELSKASNMLSAAALTYVAAVATSLLQILRLILLSSDRKN
jgi:Zn-dependent membrane protease YugP